MQVAAGREDAARAGGREEPHMPDEDPATALKELTARIHAIRDAL